MLFFAAPVTALWLFVLILEIDDARNVGIAGSLMLLVAGLSLFSLWRFFTAFFLGGSTGLKLLSNLWLVGITSGIVWSVLGIVISATLSIDARQNSWLDILGGGFFGAPALVPSVHLIYERLHGGGAQQGA